MIFFCSFPDDTRQLIVDAATKVNFVFVIHYLNSNKNTIRLEYYMELIIWEKLFKKKKQSKKYKLS
jgi:hypothetical protein